MRRAATALAATIRRVLTEHRASAGPVVLLVGSGDNGGDALFAGAELAREKVGVLAIPTSERRHAAGEQAARDAGVLFVESPTGHPDAAADAIESAAIVVDGILGTGTSSSPALRGSSRDVVATAMPIVARRGIPVVAVDLPSGIHPDDGTVPDPTVLPATVTVTFGAVKAGLLLAPASQYAGRVELVDLGLGDELARMTPLVTTE
jgi:hydroxyethylthiazole kinase-like uncharacterized protein yjeF